MDNDKTESTEPAEFEKVVGMFARLAAKTGIVHVVSASAPELHRTNRYTVRMRTPTQLWATMLSGADVKTVMAYLVGFEFGFDARSV